MYISFDPVLTQYVTVSVHQTVTLNCQLQLVLQSELQEQFELLAYINMYIQHTYILQLHMYLTK